MIVCVDSGFLTSLYLRDAHSELAREIFSQLKQPLILTALNELEMNNAFQLRIFRGEADELSRTEALSYVEQDVFDGVLTRQNLPWHEVNAEGLRLSRHYSAKLGTRSLDILHVATALLLGADKFITLDKRQTSLAKAVGLDVIGL
jgi:predicted nucleic acid-binding protein